MSKINKIRVDGVEYDVEDLNAIHIENDPTVPSYVKNISENDISSWNNKSEFSGNYDDLTNKPDLSGFITKSVDDLLNYYLKNETYTKTEVNNLIGAIQQFHYEIVQELPQTGANNILYLVPKSESQTQNVYDEYVYANNTWEKIGDTEIDLSGYVTTTDLSTALANYTTTTDLTTLLAGKQDTLVSGTNIKTINNTSLLGSGNITTATSQDIKNDKLTGTSAPTTATVGYVGQQYTDTTNNNQYVCTAINQSIGEYTWVQINGGGSEIPTYFWNAYDTGDSAKAIFKTVLEDWYNKDQKDNVLAMSNSSTDVQYVPLILQEITKASVGYSKTANFNALLMGANHENNTVITGRWYRARIIYNLTLNDGIYTVTVTYISNDQPTFSISGYGVLDYDGVNYTAYRRALKVDNTKAYTPTGDYNPATKKYVDDYLTTLTGYDATKTQVLKNVQGVLQWQDES